jgi:hypothetical protein
MKAVQFGVLGLHQETVRVLVFRQVGKIADTHAPRVNIIF